MRLIRLEDDEGGIGIGMPGRKEEIDRADRGATRLEAKETPQLLPLRIGVQPVQLIGNRVAGYLRHAADRHPADLALTMNIQQLDRTLPTHGPCSYQTWRVRPPSTRIFWPVM